MPNNADIDSLAKDAHRIADSLEKIELILERIATAYCGPAVVGITIKPGEVVPQSPPT